MIRITNLRDSSMHLWVNMLAVADMGSWVAVAWSLMQFLRIWIAKTNIKPLTIRLLSGRSDWSCGERARLQLHPESPRGPRRLQKNQNLLQRGIFIIIFFGGRCQRAGSQDRGCGEALVRLQGGVGSGGGRRRSSWFLLEWGLTRGELLED